MFFIPILVFYFFFFLPFVVLIDNFIEFNFLLSLKHVSYIFKKYFLVVALDFAICLKLIQVSHLTIYQITIYHFICSVFCNNKINSVSPLGFLCYCCHLFHFCISMNKHICVCIYWRSACNPLQYFCLENPMDRGTWQATGSQRVRHD